MSDRWLTIKDAAARVGVDESTVWRYITQDGLPAMMGRVRESRLVEVHEARRERKARGQFKAKRRTLADDVVVFAVERNLSREEETLIRSFVKFATR